jgi:hypothetical protein
MDNAVERRAARRFSMMLPLKVRFSKDDNLLEKQGETRDVSSRAVLYDRRRPRSRRLYRICSYASAANHARR